MSIRPFLRAPGGDTRTSTHAQNQPAGTIDDAVRQASLAFVEHVSAVGLPCLEVEYRLGHVPRPLKTAMVDVLNASEQWTALPCTTETDRRSPGGGGPRCTIPTEGEPAWVHKERLCMVQIHANVERPIKLCLSSEIPVEPGNVDALTIYRTKRRQSWTWTCWRVDVTEVETNDPALRDADDIIEIEVELVRDHDLVLYYDTPTLLRWGFEVLDGLLRATQ